jgi:hypothetical protein
LCGNEIGVAGRIAELAAKAIDQEIDTALTDFRAFTRNPVEQLIATNHQTRPVAQGVQNSPLGPRKSNVAGFIQGNGARKIRRKKSRSSSSSAGEYLGGSSKQAMVSYMANSAWLRNGAANGCPESAA